MNVQLFAVGSHLPLGCVELDSRLSKRTTATHIAKALQETGKDVDALLITFYVDPELAIGIDHADFWTRLQAESKLYVLSEDPCKVKELGQKLMLFIDLKMLQRDYNIQLTRHYDRWDSVEALRFELDMQKQRQRPQMTDNLYRLCGLMGRHLAGHGP